MGDICFWQVEGATGPLCSNPGRAGVRCDPARCQRRWVVNDMGDGMAKGDPATPTKKVYHRGQECP